MRFLSFVLPTSIFLGQVMGMNYALDGSSRAPPPAPAPPAPARPPGPSIITSGHIPNAIAFPPEYLHDPKHINAPKHEALTDTCVRLITRIWGKYGQKEASIKEKRRRQCVQNEKTKKCVELPKGCTAVPSKHNTFGVIVGPKDDQIAACITYKACPHRQHMVGSSVSDEHGTLLYPGIITDGVNPAYIGRKHHHTVAV